MMHQLLSEDEYVSCLICGGLFGLDDFGDVFDGRGNPANGSWACSGDTSTCHGDPVEHGDAEDDPRYGHCECLLCV